MRRRPCTDVSMRIGQDSSSDPVTFYYFALKREPVIESLIAVNIHDRPNSGVRNDGIAILTANGAPSHVNAKTRFRSAAPANLRGWGTSSQGSRPRSTGRRSD